MLRLSVLDQSPIRSGGTAAEAVAETLELAQACDRWGYHRCCFYELLAQALDLPDRSPDVPARSGTMLPGR